MKRFVNCRFWYHERGLALPGSFEIRPGLNGDKFQYVLFDDLGKEAAAVRTVTSYYAAIKEVSYWARAFTRDGAGISLRGMGWVLMTVEETGMGGMECVCGILRPRVR